MADPRLTVVDGGSIQPPHDTAPAFYFDFSIPEAYLAAERILSLLPVPCEWRPVRSEALPGGPPPIDREAIAATARERGLQPVRWPDPLPFDSELALLAAAFARAGGKTVSFSLAAFRQAYAGGRALTEETVLLAGAACEIHPRALVKGIALRTTRTELDRLTAEAVDRGVRAVPALWTAAAVYHGDAGLGRAAAALA
jgi:2-hydroxychromene-2-carboxylate isomerase